MKSFQITSNQGIDLGTYEAETPIRALDKLAQNAGSAAHATLCATLKNGAEDDWTTDPNAFGRGTISLLVVEVAPLCAFCHAAPRIDGSPLCVEHDPIVTWVRVPEDEAGAWALIADLHVVEVSDAWSGKSCEGGDNAGRERRMIPGSPSHVRHYASKEVPS